MIIALIISAVVTGIITYVLSFKYETPSVKEKEEVEKTELKDSVISTPISGEIISLHDVNDEAFASEALGKGFGINPDEGKVFSPFDGKIVALFPTKHAIGLLSDSGAEILIHVGLNTVELNGKFFKSYVSKNQHVKKGQLLLEFDISQIQKAGYSTQVPVIVTNTFQYSSINNTKFGFAANGDNVLVAKI